MRRGSSPRVRGKRRRWIRGRGAPRLIPARAGKTLHPGGRLPGRAAHPRACGENGGRPGRVQKGRGSSPRVRGKRCHESQRKNRSRLIPARAGKTHVRRLLSGRRWAHPRACGENGNRSRGRSPGKGSSPRVRGKRAVRHSEHHGSGLIPARAGKTMFAALTVRRLWAHPRACGENEVAVLVHGRVPGSSPRVRGKRDRLRCDPHRRRLIPARAGKTPP